MPLFGTQAHPAHYYAMQNHQGPIVLWLDKDQENVVKRKVLALESVLGVEVRSITTDKDPKELSINEINEVLQ